MDILNGAINADRELIDNKLLLAERLSLHMDLNTVTLDADALAAALLDGALEYGADGVITEAEIVEFLAAIQ